MQVYGETVCVTCESNMNSSRHHKEQWVQHYADRMLRVWKRWQTSLGVARDYVEQLEKDLANFYEEPLKRTFIESTY